MQNRSTSFAPLIVSLVATAALALGQGCSVSSSDSSPLSARAGDNPNDKGGSPDQESTSTIADAGSGPRATFRGSKLCRVTDGTDGTAVTCMPDEDGAEPSKSVQPCSTADASLEGCRIRKDPAPPACSPANADGRDGASCANGGSSDCAPGFDCVEHAGAAVCRRYCCAGTCKTQYSQNGGPTFCDVQKLVGMDQIKAPVCMPLKRCALLTAGQCGDKETCSIVTEQGDTGCVANGPQQAGQSCDEDHCNVGLTCLGTPGSRTCYQLCKTDGSVPCGSTQACKTNTLFASSAYGVCKDIASASP